MRRKEAPQNISRRDTSVQTKVRVVWDLTGHVHGDGIPSVYSSDQLVELYFAVSTATRGVLFNHCADVSLTVTQGSRCIETGTLVRRSARPVVERLLLGRLDRGAAIQDGFVLIAMKDQNRNWPYCRRYRR